MTGQIPKDTSKNTLHSLIGKTIVVVLPTFNDWQSLLTLIPLIDGSLAPLDVKIEIVLVDDASTDTPPSFSAFRDSLTAVENITVINLTRNLGSQKSIAVGVAYSAKNIDADYLIVADSDHEDNPQDMPRLLEACVLANSQKIIFAERTKRSERFIFRFSYFIYQLVFKVLTNTSISAGSFSVSPWHIVKRMVNLPELWNHFPGAIIRAKLPHGKIPSVRGRRIFGASKMNFVPLISHAFCGFSLFSDVIAIRALIFGFIVTGMVILVGIGFILIRVFTDILVLGFTTTVLSVLVVIIIQFISSSILMLFLVSVIRMLPTNVPIDEFEKLVYKIEKVQMVIRAKSGGIHK